MASAASSFRSSASRPSTSSSPPCIWPEERHHVERNSPRHHPAGRTHADHRSGLSPRHDRDRRRDLPEAGGRQPDRKGWQGGRLRPDRAGIQGRQILPWPSLGDLGAGPGRFHQDRFGALQCGEFGRIQPRPDQQGPERSGQGIRRQVEGRESFRAGPDRSRHHVGERPRSRYLAGGRVIPGASGRQGAEYAGRSGPPTGHGEYAGSPRRVARRTARQCIGAQSGAGRRCIQIEPSRRYQARGLYCRMANQRRDLEKRPSPDALLEAARRENDQAGRLKIFVGAAPGVGKTYEMLQSAQAKRKAGADIVVGVVETHGRAETEALLQGLEVLPRKRLEYKGQIIEEMDLDALIARRPQIALVDELAHTNAPGSRHPKRYLDVEELLSHGIDVYTAVNIQHIESLNDVVAQITHVRVRETVPDSVFDRADAIELIDLTPDDLIQRLKEGKVYVPQQADTLRLAEALGGEALTIPGVGRRIADDVINFAQANNDTQIVIGKSTRSWWFETRRGSVVHDLVRRAGNISVHVIPGDELPAGPTAKTAVQTAARPAPFDPKPYLFALLIVAVGLGAAELIKPYFGIENVDLVFLTAVVGVAVRYGLWPSLFASVAASLSYNFFFLPPVYTFTITDPTNIAAFFFFMLIAI